ncbi:hypothetical protein ANTHELSMS3_00071 [Antarctobacter heliothermus]|uniref:Uncharacterized protein n=1 Tax=Antarctobacter heliothermus TaxID=74033 RepID=A0A222DXV4_9RHOB|nr:hypothetical protein [Antarctobacter heliothermus]ASP18797.1 hypothetical protein ANTHELSMS3_00071 [Antarctobacter heliothermus]
MPRFLTALPLALLPALAAAQEDPVVTVSDCDWQASAWNLAEPWEENSRTFSNGKTRLALLDTIEPAAAWAHILVLSPPYSEMGDRQCKTIGYGGMGFGGIRFNELTSSYDPATGLSFNVPVQAYNSAIADFDWYSLRFTLNQATGDITTALTQ